MLKSSFSIRGTSSVEKHPNAVSRDQYGFKGNQDVYGVGIRAGYYTQAFASWTANFFVPHEAPFLHSVNILFIVAMLVGMIFLVDDPVETWAVEPFMLLNIAYSIAYIGTGSPVEHDLLPWETGLKNGLVRELGFLSLDIFALWYWFFGLPQMKPTNSDNGTRVLWLVYAAGDLFGWIRIANQVTTVLSIVHHTVGLLFRGLAAVQDLFFKRDLPIATLLQQAKRWKSSAPCLDEGARAAKTGEGVSLRVCPENTKGRMQQSCSVDKCDEQTEKIAVLARSKAEQSPESMLKLNRIRSNTSLTLFEDPSMGETTRSLPKPERFSISYDALNRADVFFQSIIKDLPQRPWYCDVPLWLFYSLWCILASLYSMFRGRLSPTLVQLQIPLLKYTSARWPGCLHAHPQLIVLVLRKWQDAHQNVDWRALMLITRFYLVLDPCPPLKKWQVALLMWRHLSFGLLLAIGTELTIQWNYIRDIQQINTIGQLVPMVLGVGGLLKVIVGAFAGKQGWCGRTCITRRRLEQWKEIATLWKQAKEEQEALHASCQHNRRDCEGV